MPFFILIGYSQEMMNMV